MGKLGDPDGLMVLIVVLVDATVVVVVVVVVVVEVEVAAKKNKLFLKFSKSLNHKYSKVTSCLVLLPEKLILPVFT